MRLSKTLIGEALVSAFSPFVIAIFVVICAASVV